jgi:UDP-N-acetylglucosamine 2-epimerase (non-hydrolysing)
MNAMQNHSASAAAPGSQQLPKVLVIFGTRPEAIKLAPVIRELAAAPDIDVRVAVTGQHRHMLDQVLDVFNIAPDYDLNIMIAGQTLPELTSRLISSLDQVIGAECPAAVLIHGDTTTAFAAALAAFYHRVPVGHVEAGLRTGDAYAPYPEEINRRLISDLAHWHFAPTALSRAALLREGIADSSILVTGNTVIDALYFTLANTRASAPPLDLANRRLVLVTAHRRESFGAPFESLCRAIRSIADSYSDVEICYPVHLNPNVREPVERILGGSPRIRLCEPFDYRTFSRLLEQSYLILTDSGGIQEEGPALGKPVLVMRDVTERPEAIEAGVVELVGTDEQAIVARVSRLLDDPIAYAAMARAVSPYGDGHASDRICAFLRTRLTFGASPLGAADRSVAIATSKLDDLVAAAS